MTVWKVNANVTILEEVIITQLDRNGPLRAKLWTAKSTLRSATEYGPERRAILYLSPEEYGAWTVATGLLGLPKQPAAVKGGWTAKEMEL